MTNFDVIVVGGGAAGIATASSLQRRRPELQIAIIEPADTHFYQPGWTLVGGGVYPRRKTERPMATVMPRGIRWIRAAAEAFEPEQNIVVLATGERLFYRILVVCPGLKLDWSRIEGLDDTLGRNGVTSNYRVDLAPYTWELVQQLQHGYALFTQPPLPIKCPGAPQKAMYLACDYWQRRGRLKDIEVGFHTAGAALFSIAAFVLPLMRYVARFDAKIRFRSELKAVDGPGKKAWFAVPTAHGATETVELPFDLLHVCPPQAPMDFVRQSPLADSAGWVEANPDTLQHPRFRDVFSLGDACSTPNSKTAAAIRKQAPVVAQNALAVLDGLEPIAVYDGFGACPLTVERGKVVLAEFGYGGKLLPTFPFLDATKPSRLAWLLKAMVLPHVYFDLMLKCREWLAEPETRSARSISSGVARQVPNS